MNFYLIIPESNVEIEIGGRSEYKTTASIYRIYQQTSNKTRYNVFYLTQYQYPWPRKKLTRKALEEVFHCPMFYKSVEADDINELVMKLNIYSDIYKVVI